MHSTMTTRTPFTPTFEDRQPSPDATIWRVSLSAARAFQLFCDIEAAYPNPAHRPRIGAMLEHDRAWTLYVWPRHSPASPLLMMMIGYGAARLADASQWHGQIWVTGAFLGTALAAVATRTYWEMETEPALLADERNGWLLRLPRQGKP